MEQIGKKNVHPLCVCFSHDSTSILSEHIDGWILIWETEKGKPKAMLRCDETVIKTGTFKYAQTWKDDPFYSITCSPNGHFIAASYSDGIVIWMQLL